MKTRILFSAFLSATIFGISYTQVPASQDTIVIPGDLPGAIVLLHNGALENRINGDTAADGTRINPNRVYALQEGYFYYQNASININNPTGTLTIVGIPSAQGATKPVWMMKGIGNGNIEILGLSDNVVYGSLKFQNIHYVGQQLDGTLNNENFMCGTKNQLPQSLTIDNCLFEFCNIDLFDCTNETGAIGGWPYGAKFRITNSYFRNLFNPVQWWGSRVFQCKHPIDTLWVENVTITGGGLTFLQQNELSDFAYFNHNTIVNNHKYWLLSTTYKTLVVTNNIFLNQNWVGDDSTTISTGESPDIFYRSTICLDTVDYSRNYVVVQPKYWINDTYTSDLAAKNLKVFVSNNINYWNPLLLKYFQNQAPFHFDSSTGYLLAWLDWGGGFSEPQRINNVPCEWMNSRTQALFAAYSPAKGGGFVADTPLTVSPGSPTIDNLDQATVLTMAQWNQNKWTDPAVPTAPDVLHSKMIFGDYDPTTIPGIASPTDPVTFPGGEKGIGITKFTDLTENWSSTVNSSIDRKPLGALIWNDVELAKFNSAADFAAVNEAYRAANPGVSLAVGKSNVSLINKFELLQNYPNPFNPSTNIGFSIPQQSTVELKVYNTLGQEVATLVNGTLAAGNHIVDFDARNLASGFYFYRITAGNFASVKKMILLK